MALVYVQSIYAQDISARVTYTAPRPQLPGVSGSSDTEPVSSGPWLEPTHRVDSVYDDPSLSPSGGGVISSFTWDADLPQDPSMGVYDNFPDLHEAVNAAPAGARTVYHNPNSEIPAGEWNIQYWAFKGISQSGGVPDSESSSYRGTLLTFSSEAYIRGEPTPGDETMRVSFADSRVNFERYGSSGPVFDASNFRDIDLTFSRCRIRNEGSGDHGALKVGDRNITVRMSETQIQNIHDDNLGFIYNNDEIGGCYILAVSGSKMTGAPPVTGFPEVNTFYTLMYDSTSEVIDPGPGVTYESNLIGSGGDGGGGSGPVVWYPGIEPVPGNYLTTWADVRSALLTRAPGDRKVQVVNFYGGEKPATIGDATGLSGLDISGLFPFISTVILSNSATLTSDFGMVPVFFTASNVYISCASTAFMSGHSDGYVIDISNSNVTSQSGGVLVNVGDNSFAQLTLKSGIVQPTGNPLFVVGENSAIQVKVLGTSELSTTDIQLTATSNMDLAYDASVSIPDQVDWTLGNVSYEALDNTRRLGHSDIAIPLIPITSTAGPALTSLKWEIWSGSAVNTTYNGPLRGTQTGTTELDIGHVRLNTDHAVAQDTEILFGGDTGVEPAVINCYSPTNVLLFSVSYTGPVTGVNLSSNYVITESGWYRFTLNAVNPGETVHSLGLRLNVVPTVLYG